MILVTNNEGTLGAPTTAQLLATARTRSTRSRPASA